MLGWKDNDLKRNKFIGRDDDECVEYDRDWCYLLDQEVLTELDKDELKRILAQKSLNEREIKKIKHALGEE